MIDENVLISIKQVSLPDILSRCGILPCFHRECTSAHNYYVYLASYRGEQHHSLSVYKRRNDGIWLYKDHATGEVGTSLDLLVRFNICSNWREAAAFIARDYLFIDIDAPTPKRIPTNVQQPSEHNVPQPRDARIISVCSVVGSSAEKYITDVRGIPIDIADRYVRFVTYGYPHQPQPYFGIGWPTIRGGWSVRWAKDLGKGKGKAIIPPGGPSIFPVQEGQVSERCNVFEGIFDFLSYVVLSGGTITDDAIVLNSAVNANDALPEITRYRHIDCYLDNDEAGQTAVGIILNACGNKAADCSAKYSGYNDYNDFLKSLKTT